MNGIGLLVLVAAAGQISSNQDFGWQIGQDGVLEYIVQISPQEAAEMQANHLENPSDIPPQLIGRARRIVVRIGTDPLPQSPSLDEIERRFQRFASPADVQAQLGPGKISDVESDPVVNVQNPNPPPFPNLNAPFNSQANNSLSDMTVPDITSRNPTTGNLIDQAGAVAGTGPGTSPSERFLAGARDGQSTSSHDLPSTTPALPSFPRTEELSSGVPSTGTNKFENTARDLAPGAGNNGLSTGLPDRMENLQGSPNSWQSPQDRLGGPSARTADARNGLPAAGGLAGRNPNYDARTPPSLAGRDNTLSGSPVQRTPTPGFGSTPGAFASNRLDPPGHYDQTGRVGDSGYARDSRTPNGRALGYGGESFAGRGYGGGYAGGSYGGEGYGAGSRRNPRYPTGAGAGVQHSSTGSPGTDRIAANTALPPSNGGSNSSVNPGTSGTGQGTSAQSPSDNNPQDPLESESRRSNTGQNILQIFFLLSLVVNFYLGMLIRKLLGRYRSLLTSVRGQTA